MGKDPAVLFYTGDFLVGTMKMNYAQKGKYIQLLCLQHQDGHLSEDDMLSVCGDYDEKIFSKFVKDENGRYYNERMEAESVKRKRFSESRKNNANKSDDAITCIYLMKDPVSGNTKIGSSCDPERRLEEIRKQTKNREIYILAMVCNVRQILEKQLHEKYKSKKIKFEWFCLTDDEISEIISENHMKLHMENENRNRNRNDNINNKGKRVYKKKEFIPPTFEEVLSYAQEREREDLARKFYDYFTAAEWVDSNGKKVERWKAKFITWENNTEKPRQMKLESSFDVDEFFSAALKRTYGGDA